MTEDDAKTKWCPQVTDLQAQADPSANRCIGSKCMAWRWHRSESAGLSEVMISKVNGYCGLAGRE